MRPIIFLTILILSGCVHTELPHFGVVKDAETGQPLKGVVVHMDLESGIPIGPEGIRKWKGSYETVTDAEGKYSLSMKIKGQLPLELTTGHELSFFKSGYSPTRIISPSLKNTITLNPIKFYLDYYNSKEYAKKGYFDPPLMDRKPEAFMVYKEELRRMASMEMTAIGEKAVLLEIPGSKLTKLLALNKYYVFDDVSQKWFVFDAQGHFGESDNKLLYEYKFFSGWGENAIYANPDLIYLPSDSLHPDRYINPQKGGISALIGDANTYMTIEENGQSLCYFTIYAGIGSGCISLKDIPASLESHGTPKLIALTGNDRISYAVAKTQGKYQLYEISSPYSPRKPFHSKLEFTIEPLSLTIPADREIVALASEGGDIFIVFADSVIAKYSIHKQMGGPIEETNRFQARGGQISSLFLRGPFYYTTGNSKIYRVSTDGFEDFSIKINPDEKTP